jgi:hypothetical protein
VWAVGSCVAGFSDAFISTVAYSQAASIGQRYTHVSGFCVCVGGGGEGGACAAVPVCWPACS